MVPLGRDSTVYSMVSEIPETPLGIGDGEWGLLALELKEGSEWISALMGEDALDIVRG
jgi:hypothetical protein